jgi:CheY-like chemotaxis protein
MAKSVILIVVDNPAHRVLFNKYLRTTPHSLVFSMDGEDGFDRFAEVKPDLVIAHVNVSRLDGPILCQLIRQQPGGSDVPFVLIGEELVDPAIAELRRKAAGADAALPVPFNRKVLGDCITPLLAFGRPEEETSSPQPPPRQRDDPDPPTIPIPAAPPDPPAAEPPPEPPPPKKRREEADLDTVVSFVNPFYRPEAEESNLEPRMLEPPTVLFDDGSPSDSDVFVSESSALTAFDDEKREIEPAEKAATDPNRVDPLAEPKIDTGIRRVDRPSSSDLIHEPKRDLTPSRSDEKRASQVKQAAGGQRRGLDESQLGKRLAKRVRATHQLLDQVDYYQILGVDPSATDERITTAYFDLSLEFHPDRFFLLRSGDLKEKIYDIYRRIAEAYQVLHDRASRAAYDERRAGGQKRNVELIEPIQPKRPKNGIEIQAKTPEGERFVSLASEALGAGDLNAARLHLHLALTYERGNAAIQKAIGDVAKRMRPQR